MWPVINQRNLSPEAELSKQNMERGQCRPPDLENTLSSGEINFISHSPHHPMKLMRFAKVNHFLKVTQLERAEQGREPSSDRF